MKKVLFGLGAAALLSSGSAMADDLLTTENMGTINFSGTVIPSACKVSTDSKNIEVNLGTVPHQVLKRHGSSNPVEFKIRLDECNSDAVAEITFSPADNGAKRVKHIVPNASSTAKGVGISLYDGNDELDFTTGSRTVEMGEEHATEGLVKTFSAKMIGAEPAIVAPGSVNATLNFTVQYH